MLQWGHDLAVMERNIPIRPVATTRSFNGAMTLRSWRDRNATSRSLFLGLQWGHDLAVMESDQEQEQAAFTNWLQWGHDLAVMESGAHACHMHQIGIASKGP